MPKFDVIQTGTDPSGRAIFMTRYMAEWWSRVVMALGFEPTIVQGAFMVKAGGGATASAGYHDKAGCLDLRTWDLTEAQIRKVIRVTRQYGAASWVRDEEHGGMDPHIHLTLGTDHPLSAGAEIQWEDYIDERDGLATKGRDYHWRPDPLILTPPPSSRPVSRAIKAAITAARSADLASAAKRLRAIRKNLRP